MKILLYLSRSSLSPEVLFDGLEHKENRVYYSVRSLINVVNDSGIHENGTCRSTNNY